MSNDYCSPLALGSFFIKSAWLVVLSTSTYAVGLKPLSDEDLSNVQGREGVAISFDYYYNADPATGAALATNSYACGEGANYENCLFTWQISGREQGWGGGYKGEWLAYKEGHLTLNVKRLALEASFLGDAKSAANEYLGYHNIRKFQDSGDGCLLEDKDCSAATLKITPALRTYYPDTHGGYNSTTGQSIGYDDVRIGLAFERLAVEYDNGAELGYTRDAQGSFMGLQIKDNNGPAAGIAFGGEFYMYGF